MMVSSNLTPQVFLLPRKDNLRKPTSAYFSNPKPANTQTHKHPPHPPIQSHTTTPWPLPWRVRGWERERESERKREGGGGWRKNARVGESEDKRGRISVVQTDRNKKRGWGGGGEGRDREGVRGRKRESEKERERGYENTSAKDMNNDKERVRGSFPSPVPLSGTVKSTKVNGLRQTSIASFFPQDKFHSQSPATPFVDPSSPWRGLNIPLPSITTFNLNSLSEYAKPSNKPGRRRRVAMRNTIATLLKNCDILMLQESHLHKHASGVLDQDFPDFSFFYSNFTDSSGGVITGFNKKKITRFFNPTPILVPGEEGFLLPILLTPKQKTSSLLPFLVTNVYLKQGDKKKSQLEKLLKIPPSNYHFLGGDFNLVDKAQDAPSTTSPVYCKPGTPLRSIWDDLLEHFSLFEVSQPTHTRYGIRDSLDKTTTSRLDRLYISFSPADMTLVSPFSFTPFIQNSILNLLTVAQEPDSPFDLLVKNSPHSDHIPVSCIFHLDLPPPKRNSRPTRISKDLASIPSISEAIEDNLSHNLKRHFPDPFRKLKLWKRSIRRAVSEFFKHKSSSQKAFENKGHFLTSLTRLYRAVNRDSPEVRDTEIHSVLSSNPQLGQSFPNCTSSGSTWDEKDRRRLVSILNVTLEKHFKTNCSDTPLPPPSTTPQISLKNQSIFDEMKSLRRSNASKVLSLRSSISKKSTSDPLMMAKIVRNFWSKIWSARLDSPDSETLQSYLGDYDGKVSNIEAALMSIPSPDTSSDFINKSGNSCAGPDGIPFSFCRNSSHPLGKILTDILYSLSQGNPPPDDFNAGDLYLLRKNCSDLIKDTRPITVGNSVYRIAAKIMVEVITPALKRILLPNQKGFVPTRQGSDHITDLTSLYYSKLEKKEQIYVLFLDTAKAFDSIDHSFIHAILAKAGFPLWVRNIIKGFLHEVKVYPTVGADLGPISVCRGVKQGCPLSPLLFALCFDVLLRKLRYISGHSAFAFADDMAACARKLGTLVKVLNVIRTFSEMSGLGLNVEKTKILSSLKTKKKHQTYLARKGWGQVHFVDSAVYLGVLIGRSINTIDIFTPAMDKFCARVHDLSSILKPKSLNKRTLIFNIYLIPIFLYLAQFYIIPYHEIILKINNICHRNIVPFNGGAFAYYHLINPTTSFGPSTPLIDLWSVNVALLAQHFDMAPSHYQPLPVMGDLAHVSRFSWSSLLIHEHRAWGAFNFLEYYCDRVLVGSCHVLVTEGLARNCKKTRALIKNLCASKGYPDRDSTSTSRARWTKPSLPNRLAKAYGLCKQAYPNPRETISHKTRSFSKKLRSDIWDTYFRFVFHALPTDYKRFSARMSVQSRIPSKGTRRFPCYLCGCGGDTLTHIYTRCKATLHAARYISHRTRFPLTLSFPSLLMQDNSSSHPLVGLIKVVFIWAVWNQREHYFTHLPEATTKEAASDRIQDFFFANLPCLQKKKSISLSPRVSELALNPPTADYVIAFSDGSALNNPGPTGSGVYLSFPPTPSLPLPRVEIDITLSYGIGDNNIGEMLGLQAILLILARITARRPLPSPALVFSDSLTCILYLTANWPPPCRPDLAAQTRELYRSFPRSSRPRLYWVRGHADVPLNERVDILAKKGANLAKNLPGSCLGIDIVYTPHGVSPLPRLREILLGSLSAPPVTELV